MTIDLEQFPDFTQIEEPEAHAAVETGDVSHVFSHPDHGRVTVYESLRLDFVAVHDPTPDEDTTTDTVQYYRIDPDVSIGMSTVYLMDEGWDLDEFDAELADHRIGRLMRETQEFDNH